MLLKYLEENQPCFIAKSKTIENVMDFIKLVAKSSDTPILIIGDTGTGKEFIARAIHARSPVFQGPFVTVNCAAIPDDLIESELFGYEEGAFSGAKKNGKKGLVEEAENGTLFLDEVGDLSPAGQAKLLRFLENGEFYRVGATKKSSIKTTRDKDFTQVIKSCAETRIQSGEETWIGEEMQQAYIKLHQMGYAHSIECRIDNILVAGLYGIALDKVFFGESMFSLTPNGSKFALIELVSYLKSMQFRLIDCQMTTDLLVSFGAKEITGKEFQMQLQSSIKNITPSGNWNNDL